MGTQMQRRAVIAGLGLAWAVPWPARSQYRERVYRVAFIAPIARDAPQWAEVLDQLRKSGFVEGKNLVVDLRGLGQSPDRAEALMAELIGTEPDLIYCGGDAAMHAAAKLAKSIPVVATADDFLATGLAASLAHPGGNFTGMSLFAPELNGKRIELLIEMLPGITQVAVLSDLRVADPKNLEAIATHLRSRGVRLLLLWVRQEDEIGPTIEKAKASGAQAISVLSSPLLHSAHRRILGIVAGAHLPAIFQWPEYVAEGAFAAYGPRLLPIFRRVGQQMVEVLKGTKPAEIPIEQPAKFELLVNLKTAKALGLTLPQSLLARADEVIE
jgi:putative tryptophan/tyrosine transport system substrate-binding protein